MLYDFSFLGVNGEFRFETFLKVLCTKFEFPIQRIIFGNFGDDLCSENANY